MLSQERVKELFDYHEDGYLIYKIRTSNRTHIGDIAGTLTPDGYLAVSIDYKKYLVHRLIFLWHHGYLPDEVDHGDRSRQNGRIENLREATRPQNNANSPKKSFNTSGFKGVTWDKRRQKWLAQIQFNKKCKFLGYYDDPEEGHAKYCEAGKQFFGEFFNPG